jgi:hypothetical protein
MVPFEEFTGVSRDHKTSDVTSFDQLQVSFSKEQLICSGNEKRIRQKNKG